MTVDSTEYTKKPRHYALGLVENGVVSAGELLNMCVNYLTSEDVKIMLDMNELSPRFLNDEDDDSDGMLVDDSFGEEDEDTES